MVIMQLKQHLLKIAQDLPPILTPSVKNLACENAKIPEITKEIDIIEPNIANSFGSKFLDKYKVFINEILMLIK